MHHIVHPPPARYDPGNRIAPRSIFRSDALRRYAQGREQKVLPRLIAPGVFRHLWILLILLIVAGLVASSISIPIYASGSAVVITQNHTPALVAFLPPDTLTQLQTEQYLFLQSEPAHERLRLPITHIEPQIISPTQARQRFTLTDTALAVTQPSVVVTAGLPDELSSPIYQGALFQVEIQVGSRRVLALLPLIGSWFE